MKKIYLNCIICIIYSTLNSYGQTYTVGAQTGTTLTNPFGTEFNDSRYQYTLTVADLTAAGMSAHSVITSIAYNVQIPRTHTMNGLAVSMKHTAVSILSDFDNTGLTQVYTGNAAMSAAGWQTLTFQNNFVWNGTDNLLIQLCFDNATNAGASNNVQVTFRAPGGNRAIFERNNTNAVSGCDMSNVTTSANIPITRFVVDPVPVATLSNYAASGTLSTNFAHRRGASATPKFTLSGNIASNAVQIELNTASNFSGTAYTTTINDGSTYTVSTLYDFLTTQTLPAGDRTYFVRARLSNTAGGTWGPWTTQLWPYSFYSATPYPEEGWYYTVQEQFSTGTVQETLYNFISIQDNGTSYPDDDYFRLNQGAFNLTVSDNGDQYLTENTSNFSGANSDYLTVGSYYQFSAQRDFNGYRFTNFPVPNGASVLTSNLKVYSHHRNNEPISNNTNPLYLELVGVNQTNVNAWANSTNTATGGPRWRVRKGITIPWNITDSWTDLALMTSPDISSIIEDIVGTSGYNAGNAIAVIIDYTGGSHTSAIRHRYFSTGRRNVAYRPSIEGTFTNFYNTVRFPNVDRAMYGSTVGWDELRITDNTVGCGACYTEYRIHDAGSNAVLAGPFVRNAGMSGSQYFDISSVGTQHIYVSARVYRNNTPTIQDIWLTVTEPFPLPVELDEFHGKCENGQIDLKWNTVSEKNTDVFVIESSVDGESWKKEGEIDAAGISNKPVYYDFSVRPRADENYYRLKMIDFDGKPDYSPIVYVPCSQKGIFVYPNPNNGVFTIFGADEGDFFQIYNAQGKEVLNGGITSTHTPVSLEGMSKGTYILKLVNKGEEHQFKIVSQD